MLLEETSYCNCKQGDCLGSSDRLKKFSSVLRLGPGLISISPLSNIKKIVYSHLTDNKYIQTT